MIKLVRGVEPAFLRDNKDMLLKELEEAIEKYGGYKDIPDDEKAKLVAPYRHKEVKAALVESSNGKCAFCECIPSEGGNVEVEHYKPKSLYPSYTFDWDNLLPACRRCNGDKSHHDTVAEPIVNPFEHNPEEYFFYEGLNLKGRPGDLLHVAELTIEVCGLNTLRLWEPRSKIYVCLHDFEFSIRRAVKDYQEATTPLKKSNRLRSIREAIDRIEMLARNSERYSSFCDSYLKSSNIYLEAKKMLD